MNFKLFYIGEPAAMPAEDKKTAEAFIAGLAYAVLGTCSHESGARLSGLSHFPGANLEQLCYATDCNSQKVKNLQENPVCEIMYTDGNGQVILTGKMEICTDPETKRTYWVE
ncbi:MAG: pyridoxamine 5'-phosphate oxidase family protein, partial [Tannerellaceae bacterium]|nr:pyridoxamine 5'-phosphate oxidase family protein [Tannerellaceae bacterium]